MTWLQLDPSTQAPCTSNTLAFARRLVAPAGLASAAEAKPEACAAARPANAAVPLNTARRVGMPMGSSLKGSAPGLLKSNQAALNCPKPSVNARQGRASTARSRQWQPLVLSLVSACLACSCRGRCIAQAALCCSRTSGMWASLLHRAATAQFGDQHAALRD
jgi:hypothetical protein